MRRTITAALVAFGLLAAACSVDAVATTTTQVPRPIPRPNNAINAVPASQALQGFDQCEAFLDHVISEAVELVGPYGSVRELICNVSARGMSWHDAVQQARSVQAMA